MLILLVVAGATGLLLYKQHLEEQARRPYREAGLGEEQISSFLAKYPKQNGNSTWVDFAKSWVNDKALADESLKTFGNLKDSLEYLYSSDNNQLLMKSLEAYGRDAVDFVNFVKSNDYDGLGFLNDFPQFAENYTEVLPAYSANPSLVKIVYDQFQRDPRINLDGNDLFLEALKVYQNLGVKGLKRMDSVWLVNNASVNGFRNFEGLRKALEFF